MFELTVDETAIATAVLGNIALHLSIQIQKYAKKQIIDLALNGLSTDSLQRLWNFGVTLLVISESFYFIAFGLGSDSQMLPLGVFTSISNTTLPPLFFESLPHTIVGSLLCQVSVLLLLLADPRMSSPQPADFGVTSTQTCLVLQILLGFVFLAVRAAKPANCSYKLVASCGLSALMGTHVVTALKVLATTPESSVNHSVVVIIVAVCLLMEFAVLYESVQVFPIWQVVPHHFAVFMTLVVVNKACVFGMLRETGAGEGLVLVVAHGLLLAGVWTSAKPHLDIPPNIGELGVLPQLKRQVLERGVDLGSDEGYKCLRSEYCQLVHRTAAATEASPADTV